MLREERDFQTLRPIRCKECRDIFMGEKGKDFVCTECRRYKEVESEIIVNNKINESYLKSIGKDRL